LGCYHNWVALPLRSVTVDGPPFFVPRYLHLDLGRQTQRNVACFRLHSHVMRVETRSWEHHDGTCDKCGLQAIQDEKHSFLCPCMQMCSLRLQFADLFHDLPMAHKITVNQPGAFYFSQACSEDVFNSSRNKLMIPIVLFQSLWIFFWWLVFTSNLISQTMWLKVKLKLVKLFLLMQTYESLLFSFWDYGYFFSGW